MRLGDCVGRAGANPVIGSTITSWPPSWHHIHRGRPMPYIVDIDAVRTATKRLREARTSGETVILVAG